MNENHPFTYPDLTIHFTAKLGENVEINISGHDVAKVSAALLHFGLGTPNAAPAAEAQAPAEKTPAAVAERLSKKGRAKKEEVAAEPVEKPAEEAAPSETPATPPAASSEAAPAPSTPAAEEPAAVAPSATPEEAAAAVKAYGAKHGIDAARALLQKFGFARTGDITPEKAGEVVAAAA